MINITNPRARVDKLMAQSKRPWNHTVSDTDYEILDILGLALSYIDKLQKQIKTRDIPTHLFFDQRPQEPVVSLKSMSKFCQGWEFTVEIKGLEQNYSTGEDGWGLYKWDEPTTEWHLIASRKNFWLPEYEPEAREAILLYFKRKT